MLSLIKSAVKKTPLAIPYIWAKGMLTKPTPQNGETEIIEALLARFDVPKCFVEFGFGGWEFNCASLAYKWEGLLLDGDRYNVTIARTILPTRVRAEQLWITRETLSVIKAYARDREIGILSIDVDGNDYWFLEELIGLRPAIIISEYNATMGHRSITIPYNPTHHYRDYPTIHYWGASLAALTSLAERNGYSLVAVLPVGINAFFVRNDLLGPDDKVLSAHEGYRDQYYGEGNGADVRWLQIKGMPFVTV